MEKSRRPQGRDLDRDPETGQPEDHLGGVAGGAFAGGTAGGLAGAAVAGAATGTIAGGPLGTVAGAIAGVVAGSVIGGIAGKALAERVNPAHEDEYWRHEFPSRPYAVASPHGWDDFGPAYRYGYERYPAYEGRRFDEVEPEFARDWEQSRGDSRLAWDEARHATRDAYERIASSIERALPGDADRDGR
ncbi:MAG TPA: hypothetical protein VNS57_06325 [Steroidobacteraceae bacterium]|nr:hypothetical protein [Steroidobacteraceae bacterium]